MSSAQSQLFSVYQGDDAVLNFAGDGTLGDITSWVMLYIQKGYVNGVLVVEFTRSATIVSGPSGTFTVAISSADTVPLSPYNNHEWEVRRTTFNSQDILASGVVKILSASPVVGTVAPAFTSPASTTFYVGTSGSFTVTTIGIPTPAISVAGALPSGVTFTDNGNGTATLTGVSAAGFDGTYNLVFTANNGIGTPIAQPFTLTVIGVPLNGLLARYPFTDGIGTVLSDTSVNGYNGTFGAGLGSGYYPTWTAYGVSYSVPSPTGNTIGIPAAALLNAQTAMVFCTPTLGVSAGMLTCIGNNLTGGFFALAPGDGRPGSYYEFDGDIGIGGNGFGSNQPIISGTMGICWRLDGTVWVNSVQVPGYQLPRGVPTPLSGFTAAYIGSFFSGNSPFVGGMYYVLTWNRQLSNAELLAAYQTIANVMVNRGLTMSVNTTIGSKTLIAADGDSITRGQGGLSGKAHIQRCAQSLTGSGSYAYFNLAVGGQSSAGILANQAQLFPTLLAATGIKILTVMIGTNDFFSGTLANVKAYCTAAYAAVPGLKINIVMGLPRAGTPGSFETARAVYNTALPGLIGVYCDVVTYWGTDQAMGQGGQAAVNSYYQDGLHPTDLGHTIGGLYEKQAICQIIPTTIAIIRDLFTDADNTSLTSHTPDIDIPATSWANVGVFGVFEVESNTARNRTNLATGYAVIDSGVSDCIVQVDITETVGGDSAAGIVFRYVDSNNYWKFIVDYAGASSTWTLTVVTSGTPVVKGTGSLTMTTGTPIRLSALLSGSNILVCINQANVANLVNNTNQTGTNHGLTSYYQSGSRDAAFDNFTVA